MQQAAGALPGRPVTWVEAPVENFAHQPGSGFIAPHKQSRCRGFARPYKWMQVTSCTAGKPLYLSMLPVRGCGVGVLRGFGVSACLWGGVMPPTWPALPVCRDIRSTRYAVGKSCRARRCWARHAVLGSAGGAVQYPTKPCNAFAVHVLHAGSGGRASLLRC